MKRLVAAIALFVGVPAHAELDAGAWLTLDGDANDLFSNRPEALWRTVLARQPGRLSWLAEAPDELFLN